jgi:hypothetical protein
MNGSFDSLVKTDNGTPLRAAARMADEMMALLDGEISELVDQGRLTKRLERVALSANAEYEQLRRHVQRNDVDQTNQSIKRLVKKIVRLQRRILSM